MEQFFVFGREDVAQSAALYGDGSGFGGECAAMGGGVYATSHAGYDGKACICKDMCESGGLFLAVETAAS